MLLQFNSDCLDGVTRSCRATRVSQANAHYDIHAFYYLSEHRVAGIGLAVLFGAFEILTVKEVSLAECYEELAAVGALTVACSSVSH